MKLPKVFLYINKGIVFRLFYIHFGFSDYILIWIVNGKLYDFLFIKIK